MEKKKGILILIAGLIIFNIILLIPNNKDYQIKEDNIAKEEYNSLSMYIVDGEEETPTNNMPNASEYELDSKSYCLRGKDKLTDVLKNIDNNFAFTNLKTDDKCYLYFSKKKTPSEKTLSELELHSQGAIGTITGPSCSSSKGTTCWNGETPDNKTNNMAQNGIYEAEDDFGTSYVFRGTVDNNWIKFGQEGGDDLWWRIIRVNGNGTIRLIYSGKGNSPSTTGVGTQIATTYSGNVNQKYNANYNDNTYVGFMYGTTGQTKYADTHKNTNKSTIMQELETWYKKTTLGSLNAKIDVNTGFCNDRSLSPEDHGTYKGVSGGGAGTTPTAYAAYHRTKASKSTSWDTTDQEPTLKCAESTRNLFTGPDAKSGGSEGKYGKVEGNGELTNPVGLITADEVIYAGGFAGQNNDGYWLHTQQNYWTISPSYVDGSYADVFFVDLNGRLDYSSVAGPYGVRPVINLKADTKIEFQNPDGENKGTTTNPYIVK